MILINETMTNKFNNKYRIESNRWLFGDYSAHAHYFITICTKERKCILGNIVNGKIKLSQHGNIVKNEIQKILQYHKRVLLDTWVIMPNHIHCIITLGYYDFENGISLVEDNNYSDCVNDATSVEKIHEFSLPQSQLNFQSQSPQQPQSTPNNVKQYRKQRHNMIIPKLLGKFQMKTSKQINILLNTPRAKNWQPNYYDHVIRNNKSYQRIKNYIIANPENWKEDRFSI